MPWTKYFWMNGYTQMMGAAVNTMAQDLMLEEICIGPPPPAAAVPLEPSISWRS